MCNEKQQQTFAFFAQEVSKSAVSFRGVFIEKKQIGLSKNKDRNVRPIFLEFF